jgi:hypothetical protein
MTVADLSAALKLTPAESAQLEDVVEAAVAAERASCAAVARAAFERLSHRSIMHKLAKPAGVAEEILHGIEGRK